MRRPWPLLLVGLVLLPGPPAHGAEDAAQELEALRRAIEEQRERVGRFEREERSLFETLEEMDRAIQVLSRDAHRARAEADRARARLAELEEESSRLAARRDATRRQLAVRAVALYKAGEAGPLQVLFAAQSFADLLSRLDGLRLLVARDRKLLVTFREQAAQLERARAEAEQVAGIRDAAAARVARRQQELARERSARRSLLVRVRADRTRTRQALYEMEAAAQALEETLAGLGEAPPTVPGGPMSISFATFKGRLEPPVDGTVAADFGRIVDLEYATETFRNGLEFEAEAGTPVRAVAEARVRFAGWFRGYGKLVILDHGDDYFTVSGHLDEVAVEVGQTVAAGEEIGTVGETGSLAGPRLYFEIRRGADPLDPGEWLAP